MKLTFKMCEGFVLGLGLILLNITLVASECVNIKQCMVAMKYMNDYSKNEIHDSSLQILKNAFCGTEGSEKKVRCEKIPSCYEPTDENYCVDVKDCCVALRLLSLNLTQYPEVKHKLKESTCEPKSARVKVKCSSLLNFEVMFHRNILSKAKNEICITTSGYKGICIPWNTCPTFGGKALDENLLNIMRMSVCDSKSHKVCCSLEENVKNVCGVDNGNSDKIAGGTPTHRNEFPWVVGLEYRSPKPEIRCGGSLINSQFVLTAAHCIKKDLKTIKIIGGNSQQFNSELYIREIKVHPKYKGHPVKNDIALIKIRKIRYQESTKWICLPQPNNDLPKNFTVVGSGQNEFGISTNLQMKASLPLVPTTTCRKFYKEHVDDFDSVICAGGDVGIDTCQGDSGGPLMSKQSTSTWNLYGIVSGGFLCAMETPGYYTRVDKYLNWINENMKQMI